MSAVSERRAGSGPTRAGTPDGGIPGGGTVPGRGAAGGTAAGDVPLGSGPTGWRRGWLWIGVWLIYLMQPLVRAWQQPDLAHRAVAVAALSVFAVAYIAGFALVRANRLRPVVANPLLGWLAVAVLAALSAAVILAMGELGLGSMVYVAVLAIFVLPTTSAAAAVVTIIAASVAVPWLAGWRQQPSLTFGVFIASLAVWGVVQLMQRNAQLAAAREEITRLAVADERNRLARDLHDILGHSLTVVAVKAELAGRLVRLAPERAEREIHEVERLARQALGEVRTAVAGYRECTVEAELASARTALRAAGIEADLPEGDDRDIAGITAAHSELFGWVIREGVTNVVRHSGATRCRIRIGPAEVEISDDGRGPVRVPLPRAGAGASSAGASTRSTGASARSTGMAGAAIKADAADGAVAGAGGGPGPGAAGGTGAGGHGLVGLRERVAQAGGRLTIRPSEAGGFLLRVRVP